MPLGTEVGLGPGYIALYGDPAPPRKGHSSPYTFPPVSIVAQQLPISATAELLLMCIHMFRHCAIQMSVSFLPGFNAVVRSKEKSLLCKCDQCCTTRRCTTAAVEV